MARATVVTVQDGHVYQIGEEIPDLGSLVCTETDGNRRSYEGYNSDASKLPKYDDLGTGSSASLVDESGKLHIYIYVAYDKKWNELQ